MGGGACGAPEDMAQEAYRAQWGAEGRDDPGIMKRMGANAIRLYHPIGELWRQPESRGFLDASEAAGLKVFGAVHQYLSCPEDDCYESHFRAIQDGLASGFARDGAWHSAVWAINLTNEVDAHVPFTDPVRQVKRLISAADAVFAAEQTAQISGNVDADTCPRRLHSSIRLHRRSGQGARQTLGSLHQRTDSMGARSEGDARGPLRPLAAATVVHRGNGLQR